MSTGPIGADSVGAIYVTVLADTSAMKRQIEGTSRKAGKFAAHEFNQEFQKGIQERSDKVLFERAAKRQMQAFIGSWAKEVAKAERSGNMNLKVNITDDIAKNMDVIAKKFGVSAKELRKFIEANFSDMFKSMIEAEHRAMDKMEADRLKAIAKEEAARARALAAEERETARILAREERERLRIIRTTEREAQAARRREENQQGRARGGPQFGEGLVRGLRRAGTGGFFDTLTNALGGIVKLSLVVGRTVAKVIPKSLEFAGSAVTKFGGVVGKVFPKIGKMVAGFGGVLAKVAKSPLTLIVAAVAGLTFGLKFFFLALGAVVHLVKAAAGMLTIFAGAALYTATSALALVPVLISMGVAFGVVAFGAKDTFSAIGLLNKAVSSGAKEDWDAYNEAMKKLGPNAQAVVKAFRPLFQMFKDVRKELGERLFAGVGDSLVKLHPRIDALRTLMLNVADAVSRGFKRLAENFSSPFMTRSLEVLSAAIVRIVDALGPAFADIAAGLVNFFALISPYAERLATFIQNIGAGFLAWSQSAEDRVAVLQFFDRAWTAAGLVKDIIVELAGIFFAFFSDTKADADPVLGTLEGIKTKLEEWRTWVENNKGTINVWLNEAKTTAGDVVGGVEGVLAALNRLDDPDVKAVIDGLIGAFTNFFILLGKIDTLIDGIFKVAGPLPALVGSRLNAATAQPAPPPRALPNLRAGAFARPLAAGGIVTNPTSALIGEAGAEAVIPLTRPLSQVDSSVRAMTALLRGEGLNKNKSGDAGSGGRSFNLTQNIQLANTDPEAAAARVVNRLAAIGVR